MDKDSLDPEFPHGGALLPLDVDQHLCANAFDLHLLEEIKYVSGSPGESDL